MTAPRSRSASALAASPSVVLLGVVCRRSSGRRTSVRCTERALRRVRLLAAASNSRRRAASGLPCQSGALSQGRDNVRDEDDGADGGKKSGANGGWGGLVGGARPYVAA